MNEANKSHPRIEKAFEFFAEVGKAAVLQELKVRLLAGKTKPIQNASFEFKVAKTEEAVIQHFMFCNMMTQDEKELIEKARQIRNKILHCDFDEAIKKIEALAGSLPGPSVIGIKLKENASGEEILNQIFSTQKAIAEGRRSDYNTVDELTSAEAGIFGSFLNAVQKGALNAAIEIFQKSTSVIERLITETAESDFKASTEKPK